MMIGICVTQGHLSWLWQVREYERMLFCLNATSHVHYIDPTQPFPFYNVGLVDLTAEDFSGSGIDYTGLPLWDTPLCNILPYLGAAADIINTVVSSGGRIMVNCQMGVSRLEPMYLHDDQNRCIYCYQIRGVRDVLPDDPPEPDRPCRPHADEEEARCPPQRRLPDSPHLPGHGSQDGAGDGS